MDRLVPLLAQLSVAAFAAGTLSITQAQVDKCSVGTTLDMKDCLAAEYEAAENRVALSLNKLKAKIRQNAQKKEVRPLIKQLDDTHRAWKRYRDSECDFQRWINGGGSLEGLAWLNCMQMLTEKRAKEVEVSATTWGAD